MFESSKERVKTVKKGLMKELEKSVFEYNKNHKKNDRQLRSSFDLNTVDSIDISISNKINKEEGETSGITYAYVKNSDFFDEAKLNVLQSVKSFILRNDFLPDGVRMELKYYDSFYKNPSLIFEDPDSLFKRWELKFYNVTPDIISELIEAVELMPSLKGKKIKVYSEN